jgi:hypothetical protein
MPFYHCSPLDLLDGCRLTPASTRGQVTKWAGKLGYSNDRVYLFEGSGNPMDLLSLPPCSCEHSFLYEVQPQGKPIPTPSRGPAWAEVFCDAAIVTKCVHRPSPLDYPGGGRSWGVTGGLLALLLLRSYRAQTFANIRSSWQRSRYRK